MTRFFVLSPTHETVTQSVDEHGGAVASSHVAADGRPPPQQAIPLTYATEEFSCAVRLHSNPFASHGIAGPTSNLLMRPWDGLHDEGS